MFDLSVGVPELIVRGLAVYLFLFIAFRFMGKKHVGELAPFDLLLLLIISESVQNALIADDKSLLGGLIACSVLLALSQLMNYASWRSKKADRIIEGVPKLLVRNGIRYAAVMDQEQITEEELLAAMRAAGCTDILHVRAAVLENDGKISIIHDRQSR